MDLKEKVEAKSVRGSLLCRAPQDWVTVDDALALFEEERKVLAKDRDDADRAAKAWRQATKLADESAEKAEAREAKLREALEWFCTQAECWLESRVPEARPGWMKPAIDKARAALGKEE